MEFFNPFFILNHKILPLFSVPTFCSSRYALAYVSIFGFACVYATRINLSMAIVCMVIDEDVIKGDNLTTVAMVTDDPNDACGSLVETDPGYEVSYDERSKK